MDFAVVGVYVKAAVTSTIFLLPVIMGLVTYVGKLGIQGRAQLAASMLIGLLLGVGAQIALIGVPADPGQWFLLALCGLIPGLTASGCFEVGKDLANKAAARAGLHIQDIIDPGEWTDLETPDPQG